MLPVASSLIFATRTGICASGNGCFWVRGGFFATLGVFGRVTFEAVWTRSGIAGTRNVRMAAAWVVVSRGDTYVNGSIGQGLSGGDLVREVGFEVK